MIAQTYKRLKKTFYAGPRFLGITPWRLGRYQSPTLTASLWAYALIARHLTTAGGMVVLCCALVTMYSLFTLRMPIYILAFSLLALLLLNVIGGLFFRPKLALIRQLPDRLSVDRPQRITYTLTHRGRHPIWDLLLDPMPLPRFLSFDSGRAFVETLNPGETVQLSTMISAHRRGRYSLPQTMAGTAFPFHLWRWTKLGTGNRIVVVYPSFTRLQNFHLPTGMRYQAGGIALSSRVGNSMEFFGTREFRDGDDPRRIHWRSWARTTLPVVKEFREEYLCRTALIVDTYRPHPYFWDTVFAPTDRPFEAALSLAAAISEALSNSDYIIDLFAAGPEVYRFRGGRSLGFLENILDVLACLDPHHEEPFADFSSELIEEIAQISSAVVVLLTWNPTRRDLIEQMRAAGVSVKAVFVNPHRHPPADLPGDIQVLKPDDVLGGWCTSI